MKKSTHSLNYIALKIEFFQAGVVTLYARSTVAGGIAARHGRAIDNG